MRGSHLKMLPRKRRLSQEERAHHVVKVWRRRLSSPRNSRDKDTKMWNRPANPLGFQNLDWEGMRGDTAAYGHRAHIIS